MQSPATLLSEVNSSEPPAFYLSDSSEADSSDSDGSDSDSSPNTSEDEGCQAAYALSTETSQVCIHFLN
jgi:hypothetical protein